MLQKYKKFDVEAMINKHKVVIAQEVSGKVKKFSRGNETNFEEMDVSGGDVMARMKKMDP